MKKLLMSALVLSAFACSILLVQMTSCKKSNAQTPVVYSIQGLWTGLYTVDGQPNIGQQYFSFVLKPDGTIINDTKGGGVQNLCVGSWALTGDTLACSYTCVYGVPASIGVTQTAKAYFDKTAGKLTSGTWKNLAPSSGTGTFSLNRVN